MDFERMVREMREGDVHAARALLPEAARRGERGCVEEAVSVIERAVSSEDARFCCGKDGAVVRFQELGKHLNAMQPVALVRPHRVSLVWSRSVSMLWASDCAEHLLDVVATYPGGTRTPQIVETVRRYARGEVGRKALDVAHEHATAIEREARVWMTWKAVDVARVYVWASSPQRTAPARVYKALVSAYPRKKGWILARLRSHLAGISFRG